MPAVAIPLTFLETMFPDFSGKMNKEMESQLRPVAKKLLDDALSNNLDIEAVLNKDFIIGHQLNLTVDSEKSQIVRRIARQNKVREGTVLSAFIVKAIRSDMHLPLLQQKKASSAFKKYLDATHRDERPAQNTFYEYTENALTSFSVGLIEGSTGIGKTLAILANANEVALKYKSNVVIASPTISLIQQSANEYAKLNASCDMAQLKVVVGMRSFVDTNALLELVREPQYQHLTDIITSWIQEGGIASGQLANLNLSFLADALTQIAPEIPIAEVQLKPNCDDKLPSLEVYKSQFVSTGSEPTIILTTHAMLAIEMLTRTRQKYSLHDSKQLSDDLSKRLKTAEKTEFKAIIDEHAYQSAMLIKECNLGKLPNFDHAIIDEAHLFEQNVANTLTYKSSINQFIHRVKNAFGDSFITRHNLYKYFNEIHASECFDDIELSENSPHANKYRSLLAKIYEPVLNARKKHALAPELKSEARFVLDRIRLISDKTLTLLRFSPVKRFPQIISGKNSFSFILKEFWYSLDSAVCISATLYNKKLDRDSAAYYIMKLGIPENKAKEFPPVSPRDFKSSIQAFYLADDANLSPISRRDKLSVKGQKQKHKTWIHSNAEWISKVNKSAQGGTLVLLTAIKDAQCLQEELNSNFGYDLSKIISVSQDLTLAQQKSRFIKLSCDNKKPIWLAVGAAWTGLDINGADNGILDASEDNILTDLVIPKIPFGMNKSLTHQTMMSRMVYNSQAEIIETTMLFKQGLGRLIRRSGLPKNRRIWLLDNRINEKAFQGFTSSMMRVIQTYSNVSKIKLDE